MSNGTTATGGGTLSNLMQSQGFWEFAFIVGLILLIGAHKITVEGFIDV
jgi:hypothetical protein